MAAQFLKLFYKDDFVGIGSKILSVLNEPEKLECFLKAEEDVGNYVGSFINKVYTTGTFLQSATAVRNLESMKVLLKFGANPNSINFFGQTPLMVAAIMNHAPGIKLLIAHGADIEGDSSNRSSPLFDACTPDNVDALATLIESGADLQPKRQLNYQLPDVPIKAAIIRNSYEGFKMLLCAGAEVNFANISLPHVLTGVQNVVFPEKYVRLYWQFGGNMFVVDAKGKLAVEYGRNYSAQLMMKSLMGRPRSLKAICRSKLISLLKHRTTRTTLEKIQLPKTLISYVLLENQ